MPAPLRVGSGLAGVPAVRVTSGPAVQALPLLTGGGEG